jgi:hypothetical protein
MGELSQRETERDKSEGTEDRGRCRSEETVGALKGWSFVLL